MIPPFFCFVFLLVHTYNIHVNKSNLFVCFHAVMHSFVRSFVRSLTFARTAPTASSWADPMATPAPPPLSFASGSTPRCAAAAVGGGPPGADDNDSSREDIPRFNGETRISVPGGTIAKLGLPRGVSSASPYLLKKKLQFAGNQPKTGRGVGCERRKTRVS